MLKDIQTGWQSAGRFNRFLLLFFSMLQIPVLYLLLNNIGCGFSLDRTAYEHLAQIQRVYEGNPIYAPMTFDFCAITYAPFYWMVCGWLWKLTGPEFFLPQLVSLLAAGWLFYLIARWLWNNTEKNLFLTVFGLVCLSLINLCTGLWSSEINLNSLHFALTVAGFFCLKKSASRFVFMSALCLSLGAMTKQTGLAYVAAGAAYVLIKTPRKFLYFALPATLICVGGIIWLQISSNGSFYQIIVKQNQGPPWDITRLFNEVWGSQFCGQTALLFLFSFWPLIAAGSFAATWKQMITPEYIMTTSGLVVASIAQPKFGSGNLHAVIGLIGLVICGLRGIHLTMGNIRSPELAQKFGSLIIILQMSVLIIPAWTQSRIHFIDDFDRQKYQQIEQIFKSGTTVMYHYPYLTGCFGYPDGGHSGNEMCRWVNKQWSHANKPAFLSTPYREQQYDYVLLGASIIDKSDPSIQAILDNYTVISVLPQHPNKPCTMMMRYPIYVLRANRLITR